MTETVYPKSIIVALAAIRDECGHVGKDGFNPHFKYNYASETGLQNALRPLLEKHGLVLIPSLAHTEQAGDLTHIVIDYTIAHTDGSVWPEKVSVAGSGQDKQDKGVYKANTGAHKYLLNRLFMVDTGDDPEAAKPAKAKPRKKAADKPEDAASEEQKQELSNLAYIQAEKIEEAIGTYAGRENVHALANAIKRTALETLGMEGKGLVLRTTHAVPLGAAIKRISVRDDGATLYATDDGGPF